MLCVCKARWKIMGVGYEPFSCLERKLAKRERKEKHALLRHAEDQSDHTKCERKYYQGCPDNKKKSFFCKRGKKKKKNLRRKIKKKRSISLVLCIRTQLHHKKNSF